MEDRKQWLRIIGVPCLFLVVGVGLGLLAHRTMSPLGRFVAPDTNGIGVVLDTKTGQYCNAVSVQVMGGKESPYPYCLDLYRKY
jgi:hypothetical protein